MSIGWQCPSAPVEANIKRGIPSLFEAERIIWKLGLRLEDHTQGIVTNTMDVELPYFLQNLRRGALFLSRRDPTPEVRTPLVPKRGAGDPPSCHFWIPLAFPARTRGALRTRHGILYERDISDQTESSQTFGRQCKECAILYTGLILGASTCYSKPLANKQRQVVTVSVQVRMRPFQFHHLIVF